MSLTIGKLRSLQQISNDKGIFTVVAFDHRDVFVEMLSQTMGIAEASWQTVAEEKMRICRALATYASGVMLDPLYSSGELLKSGVLPGSVGFVLAREKSGYSGRSAGRVTELEPDWSVAAIKRLGASAVKLLLFYHPDADTAPAQERLVAQVAEECARWDIPFLLEPVSYPLDDQMDKRSAAFAARRPEIVLRSAERLLPLGVDLLKAEFPTDAIHEGDESVMARYCHDLSAICGSVPWVILSAGVSFSAFSQQVRVACQQGASGFVAGRAIWREALETADLPMRQRFLDMTAADRAARLAAIATEHGRSFADVVESTVEPTEAGWHASYNSRLWQQEGVPA